MDFFRNSSHKILYIVCPRYVNTSAGIKMMHNMCDYLNRSGWVAYMVIVGNYLSPSLVNPMLMTPILTRDIAETHRKLNLRPLVLYPETFLNPLKVTFFLRLYAYYPTRLGCDANPDDDPAYFCYSQAIANAIHPKKNNYMGTMFIPAVDISEVLARASMIPRQNLSGSNILLYAEKFTKVLNGQIESNDEKISLRITRDEPESQPRHEVMSRLKHADYLICYEESAIALEARLLGCPVVFRPPITRLDRIIGGVEMGEDGIILPESGKTLKTAKQELAGFHETYFRCLEQGKEDFITIMERALEKLKSSNFDWSVFDFSQLPQRIYGKELVKSIKNIDYRYLIQRTIQSLLVHGPASTAKTVIRNLRE